MRVSSQRQWAIHGDSSPQGLTYHLRAFSSITSYAEIYDSRYGFPRRNRPTETALMAVIEKGLKPGEGGYSVQKKKYTETFGKVGYIYLSNPTCSVTPHSFRVRSITSECVDFSLLKTWLHYCRRYHGCGRKSLPPSNLTVIDCDKRKVTRAPKNCTYLTLSYVWGTPTSEDHISKQIDSTSTLPVRLPRVVEDAITVTKELQEQYLWVDKYCIDQSWSVFLLICCSLAQRFDAESCPSNKWLLILSLED
jgi:hypothetical protein